MTLWLFMIIHLCPQNKYNLLKTVSTNLYLWEFFFYKTVFSEYLTFTVFSLSDYFKESNYKNYS